MEEMEKVQVEEQDEWQGDKKDKKDAAIFVPVLTASSNARQVRAVSKPAAHAASNPCWDCPDEFVFGSNKYKNMFPLFLVSDAACCG